MIHDRNIAYWVQRKRWDKPELNQWDLTSWIPFGNSVYKTARASLREARKAEPDKEFRLIREVTYTEVIDV